MILTRKESNKKMNNNWKRKKIKSKKKKKFNRLILVNVGHAKKRLVLEVLNVNAYIIFVRNIDYLRIMNVIMILLKKERINLANRTKQSRKIKSKSFNLIFF